MIRASVLCFFFSALFFPVELHGAGPLLNHEGGTQTPLGVDVTELSVQETEDFVTKWLSQELVKKPPVTVNIVRYRNVYVSGHVKNPGGYPYEDGLTVVKVLALAGGLTAKAVKCSPDRIHVTRQNGTNGQAAESKTAALGDLILPDDIVQVPDCQNIHVSGEVKAPDAYTYENGTTVLKAIMLAGGFTNNESSSKTPANIPHVTYRLGPNDLIKVQVFGQPDLTLETRVSGDGKIRMPLLGVLHVTGLTVQETEDLVTKRLSHELLKKPRVTVNIVKYRNVYVSGHVKNPGGYPYEDGLTVLKALALAGGLTDRAAKCSPDRIHVKRPNGINGQEAENNAAAMDDLILPDDIVQVPDCQSIYVSGEVKTPGAYTYEEGMNVLKAIMMAGGFTNNAAERRVKIKRLTGGKLDSLSSKLEDRLFPDDVVVVPESFF